MHDDPRPKLKVSGVVLPEGQTRDLYVANGRVTYRPVAGAVDLGRGWIVPGLVDAHCHVGLGGTGPVDPAAVEKQAIVNRDHGVLLIRDCGSPTDTRWTQERADLPRIIRCGRHIARTGRYVRGFGREVEPDAFVSAVQREAREGDGWVKIVADWIDRSLGDLAPAWPAQVLREGIAAAHDLGARVTAHVFGELALPDLIDAGIDCIEHGTGLSAELIARMAERGTAYVPTAVQLNSFLEIARPARLKFPRYATHMAELYSRRRQTVLAAYRGGVPIYCGSDAGGIRDHGIAGAEMAELAAYGLSAFDALGAGSWRAREWLGYPPRLDEAVEADFVVFGSDPLADLTVLATPQSVVLRGRVVV